MCFRNKLIELFSSTSLTTLCNLNYEYLIRVTFRGLENEMIDLRKKNVYVLTVPILLHIISIQDSLVPNIVKMEAYFTFDPVPSK